MPGGDNSRAQTFFSHTYFVVILLLVLLLLLLLQAYTMLPAVLIIAFAMYVEIG